MDTYYIEERHAAGLLDQGFLHGGQPHQAECVHCEEVVDLVDTARFELLFAEIHRQLTCRITGILRQL